MICDDSDDHANDREEYKNGPLLDDVGVVRSDESDESKPGRKEDGNSAVTHSGSVVIPPSTITIMPTHNTLHFRTASLGDPWCLLNSGTVTRNSVHNTSLSNSSTCTIATQPPHRRSATLILNMRPEVT